MNRLGVSESVGGMTFVSEMRCASARLVEYFARSVDEPVDYLIENHATEHGENTEGSFSRRFTRRRCRFGPKWTVFSSI